jgi:hypothetical protein
MTLEMAHLIIPVVAALAALARLWTYTKTHEPLCVTEAILWFGMSAVYGMNVSEEALRATMRVFLTLMAMNEVALFVVRFGASRRRRHVK